MNYLDYKLNNIKSNFIKVNLRKLSYSFLLGVKFIPELFHFGNDIKEIRAIRGIQVKKGLVNKLLSFSIILIPMFITSFVKVQNLEKALIVKGFSFKRKRTLYKEMSLTRKDYSVLGVFGGLITLSIYL